MTKKTMTVGVSLLLFPVALPKSRCRPATFLLCGEEAAFCAALRLPWLAYLPLM